MAGGLRVAFPISGGRFGPGEARRIVSQELERFVGPRRVDDFKLLVSELVNGRLRPPREGRAQPEADGDRLMLSLEAEPEADNMLRCSVADAGPARLPSECSMRILDLLANRWGVSRDHDATQVWFETELSS